MICLCMNNEFGQIIARKYKIGIPILYNVLYFTNKNNQTFVLIHEFESKKNN